MFIEKLIKPINFFYKLQTNRWNDYIKGKEFSLVYDIDYGGCIYSESEDVIKELEIFLNMKGSHWDEYCCIIWYSW